MKYLTHQCLNLNTVSIDKVIIVNFILALLLNEVHTVKSIAECPVVEHL